MKGAWSAPPFFGETGTNGRQVEWALLCQPHSTPGRWPPASLVYLPALGFVVSESFSQAFSSLTTPPLPVMIWMSQSLSTHTTCRTRNKISAPLCYGNMFIIGETFNPFSPCCDRRALSPFVDFLFQVLTCWFLCKYLIVNTPKNRQAHTWLQ